MFCFLPDIFNQSVLYHFFLQIAKKNEWTQFLKGITSIQLILLDFY